MKTTFSKVLPWVSASAALLLLGAAPSPAQAAVSAITRKGRYLFDASGNRFYIKGVAYQLPGTVGANTAENAANGGFPEPTDYHDSLADPAACARDIPNFTTLGVNTIRVYNVNPTADHAQCMNALNDANIYVIADLALPLNGSINRAAPSWDISILNQYVTTIDNLRTYPNLLSFTVGNEVVNNVNNSVAAAFVKAAARDVKAYLKSKNSNALVGYASTDGDTWRDPLAAYLSCGSEDLSIDLYGLNNYRWCGDSSYTASGYSALTTAFQNYPIPAYFSEFGCVSQPPRQWTEVEALFSTPMSNFWSGGIAFAYFADTDNYGLTANGTVTPNADFTRLQAAYAAATGPATSQASTRDSTYAACAAPNANFLASNTLPPTPNQVVCNCMISGGFACNTRSGATPNILGSLLDYGCSLLGSSNAGNCNEISSNGQTGVYGRLSYCSPEEKLSYVATTYYEAQNRAATACDFNGNATVNSAVTATIGQALDQCASGQPANGVFTITAAGTAAPTATTGLAGNGGGSSSGNNNRGAANTQQVVWPLVGAALAMVIGGSMVLM